jgi:hypothetical protein
MNWSEFYQMVLVEKNEGHNSRLCGEKRNALETRIFILNSARAIFQNTSRFKDISLKERKIIGGVANENETQWGYFGSMGGNGLFHNKINLNNNYLSSALDEIPLFGEITKNKFQKCVKNYNKAFDKGEKCGAGIATITRLLSMKRPDYFVCLNGANGKEIFRFFGIIPTIKPKEYDRYWDEIVDPVIKSDWWNSQRPSAEEELQLFVWLGRAAFLDSIAYNG